MALSANEMAKTLINLYRNDTSKEKGMYRLSKENFKIIAGKASLKDAYLWDVDSELREDGFMTLDMRNENNQIAIVSISTVLKKFQELSDELVKINSYPSHDEDE
jgi:hypothetical protein